MHFSLLLFSGEENSGSRNKYNLLIECAKFADSRSFSSIWLPERHFSNFGGLYPNPATLHAALATQTNNISLRAGSVVLPLHNPLKIVEEWSIVDNLSNGRVGISFASGWNPDDFAFYPEEYAERHHKLFEKVRLVQKVWSGSPIAVKNGIGKDVKVRVYPTPLQKNLPTWITASGNPQTFEKAGEIGAHLLTHLFDQSIEELAEKIFIYRQARKKAGYENSSSCITVALHCYLGENIEEVREKVRKPYCNYLKTNINLLQKFIDGRSLDIDIKSLPDDDINHICETIFVKFFSKRSLIGTPDICFNLIKQLHSIGVTEVACLLDFGLNDHLIIEGLSSLEKLNKMCSANVF